jgi:hypothetical protein
MRWNRSEVPAVCADSARNLLLPDVILQDGLFTRLMGQWPRRV